MPAADLIAGTVMAKAASLMNDTARTIYTYAAMVPYLQMAMQELREHFELYGISVTQSVSAVISITAGITTLTYPPAGPLPPLPPPFVPDDFVEPLQLWEREHNVDPYIPMHRRDFLPHNLEGIQTSQFIYYTWNSQQIEFLPANRNNDIKIDYIRELFTPVVDETSIINVVNAATFLEYRTAGLLAEFIERNITSAQSLNQFALMGIDRATGIGVKSKQSIMTRRRPFRASYKKRGWMT